MAGSLTARVGVGSPGAYLDRARRPPRPRRLQVPAEDGAVDDPERKKLHKRKDGDLELELYDLEKDKYETQNLARLGGSQLEKLGYDKKTIDDTMKDLKVRLAKLEAD